MKFAKLKKFVIRYVESETNDEIISLIGKFLAHDVYKSDRYLSWLYSPYGLSFGGNHGIMEREDSKIILVPNWGNYCSYDELTPEDLEIKFDTTREQMIQILEQWLNIVKIEPIPQNIVIIQDQNKQIKIEIVTTDDPRFSRLIEDKEKASYAKLKKSSIFEDYFQVEANNKDFFSIGMLLSSYFMRKIHILEWLNSEEDYAKTYSGNIGSFYKDNGIIYINSKEDIETKQISCNLQMTEKNLRDLLNQWEGFIKRAIVPKEVFISKQNEKIIMQTN